MFNLFNKNQDQAKQDDTSEALQFKMRGEPIIKEQHSGDFTESGLEINYYNQDTLHGLHYTEEEFYAEAERRYHTFCNHYPHLAQVTEKSTFVMQTFEDWNNPDADRESQFQMLYLKKISGYTTVSNADEIPNEAEWQPIMGISLIDYAQAQTLFQKGNIDDNAIYNALGIESPIWDEVRLAWNEKLSNTEMFDAYMRFQAQPIQNQKLQALTGNIQTSEFVDLLMTDDYFMAEINAIMQATANYGIDGIQYIYDHYQISMNDYSMACMAASDRNNGSMLNEVEEYMEEKMEEYNLKFSQEAGGNVSDDVNF